MIVLRSTVRVPYFHGEELPVGFVEGIVIEINDGKFLVMVSRSAAFEYSEAELVGWMKDFN